MLLDGYIQDIYQLIKWKKYQYKWIPEGKRTGQAELFLSI